MGVTTFKFDDQTEQLMNRSLSHLGTEEIDGYRCPPYANRIARNAERNCDREDHDA